MRKTHFHGRAALTVCREIELEEGEMIPQVGGRTLRDDLGIDPVIIKVGVTREQIEEYGLAPMKTADQLWPGTVLNSKT